MTPTGSWPSTRPGTTGISPFRMWTSVPQIVVVVTRSTASCGPGTGIGRSSSRIRPGPANTAAFMVVRLTGSSQACVAFMVVLPWWLAHGDARVEHDRTVSRRAHAQRVQVHFRDLGDCAGEVRDAEQHVLDRR